MCDGAIIRHFVLILDLREISSRYIQNIIKRYLSQNLGAMKYRHKASTSNLI